MTRPESISEMLDTVLRKVGRYRVPIFLLAMVAVYGFIWIRINTLGNVQPTADSIAGQNNPIRTAHIDKSVVKRLESLRDNNVNVETLFEQARNNPFQD